MTDKIDMDFIFNPRTVAMVGAHPGDEKNPRAGIGWMFAQNFINAGYSGQIYLVDKRGGEAKGYKIYTNIKEIPGPVDYVICCIAARYTPQLVKDCVEKGVKCIHLFTSAFSEMGTEDGKQLEEEIVLIARQGGVRLIGPNCMGIYNPAAGISFNKFFPKESGRVGYICQSGGNTQQLVLLAAEHGTRFSKVISYGNACDINESDLLEYFMSDPETDIILMYIEGVKDGIRFKRLLREAAKTRPVIVYKGGYTQAGARAASSHTGSLAGSTEVWDGLMRQCGAIQVHSLDEMANLVLAFQNLSAPGGRRIGTIGMGGGATVTATDIYTSSGFVLPPLPKELQQKLRGFVSNDAGLSLNNPVDISGGSGNGALYKVGKAMAEYEEIDTLVFYLPFTNLPMNVSFLDFVITDMLNQVIQIRHEITKPIAAVLYDTYNAEHREMALRYQHKCHEAGVPTYFSIEAAAASLNKYISYLERLKLIK